MRPPVPALTLLLALAACGADAGVPTPEARADAGREAPPDDNATITAALDAIERALPEGIEGFTPRKADLVHAEHTSFAPFSTVQVEYADADGRTLRTTVTYDLDPQIVEETWALAYAEAAVREYMDGVTAVERTAGTYEGREALRVHVQRTAAEAGNEGLFDTRVIGVRLGAHCFLQVGTPIADAVPADELERLAGAFDLDRLEAACTQPPPLDAPSAAPMAITDEAAGARAAFEGLTAETTAAPLPEALAPPLGLLRAFPAALPGGLVLTGASASLNPRRPQSYADASYESEDEAEFSIRVWDAGVVTADRKFDLERPDRLFGCIQDEGEAQPILIGAHPACLTPNASRPAAGQLFVLLDGGMEAAVRWQGLGREELAAALGALGLDGLSALRTAR